MANINSLSSNSYSSSSSIYGNRNVLTGLASGMDTEAMIENAVSGYQTKISELQQSQTKLEWKQDAYRELIDQMYSINQKYTSYTSKTNLSSNTFFTTNVTTTTKGGFADAISATGKATSDIQINAVTQLAAAARYAVDASALDVNAVSDATGEAINWNANETVGQISGTMTIKIGSTSIDLKFTEDDKYTDMDSLVEGINAKLADTSVTRKGEKMKAGDLVSVERNGNTVRLVSKNAGGDAAYINSISGNLATTLGASKPASTNIEDKIKNNSFTVSDPSALSKQQTTVEYLSGKLIDVTLDGVNKQIKIGDLASKEVTIETYDGTVKMKLGDMTDDQLKKASDQIDELLKNDLQASIDKQFGKGRVTVGLTAPVTMTYEQLDGDVSYTGRGLTFDVAEGSGSTLKVASSAGEKLGIGKAGVSNYFNTSKTLGDLLSGDDLAAARMKAAEGPIGTDALWYDTDGNRVKKADDGNFYRIDSNGKFMMKADEKVAATGVARDFYTDSEGNLVKKYANWDGFYRVNEKGEALYGLEINGTTIGGFTEDTALETVLSKINSSADAGVKVSYSNLTSQFVFTANETGEGSEIKFGDGLAKKLFGVKDNQQIKLGDLLEKKINWSDDGTARLYFAGDGSISRELRVTKDTTIQELISEIEADEPRFQGLIRYDADTGTFSMVDADGKALSEEEAAGFSLAQLDRKTGKTTEVSMSELLSGITGAVRTNGADAIIDATVNGKQMTLQRSSNVVSMDGLSVTLKEEFSAYDPATGKVKSADAVTFKTSSDADAIVDAIKSFVEDVNKLMTSVHDAYTTQPIKKTSSSSSKGTTYYEPLTEDDKKDMSESAVSAYEEKAKTGLLFGDSDLRTLYDKLLNSVQAYGTDRMDMEAIGLKTAYSNGITQFDLDETQLRSVLESDPDKVRNVFTKTMDNGSATNGLMTTLKTTLNAYASTSIASPGILVSKAGTKLSSVSLLNNNLAKQISNLDTQIENWQTKLSNRVDYYTKQFTQLEQLMSTMNNQSSMLADMMGY